MIPGQFNDFPSLLYIVGLVGNRHTLCSNDRVSYFSIKNSSQKFMNQYFVILRNQKTSKNNF